MMWAAIGSILMFLAVGLGAFGAHALKSQITPERLAVFDTGVRYHLVHALALFAVAWLSTIRPGMLSIWAGRLFVGGIVLFSGSLYLLALTGRRGWGAVTPIGGICFLVGWLVLFLEFARR